MNVDPYLTPYKYGKPVLVGSGQPGAFDEKGVDCPFVFQHHDQFYMMYVGFDGIGYQTALATSQDLLRWAHLAVILRRDEGSRWDAKSIAGTWIMRDNRMDAPPVLKKWGGKYWLAYHAYPEHGYEQGPGRIGLAWSEDDELLEWHRSSVPILVPEEGAEWERGGLYKECLIEHEGAFYLFYNAKNTNKRWAEQIGVAFSNNLENWKRYERNPVVLVSPGRWDGGFVSEPCVLRYGDEWAMFFFGYDYHRAQEGIAFSRNLIHWEKYPEPIIRVGEEGEIDSVFAHKPSVITHQSVLYHFYCSCRRWRDGDPTKNLGNEFRTITVAASAEIF